MGIVIFRRESFRTNRLRFENGHARQERDEARRAAHAQSRVDECHDRKIRRAGATQEQQEADLEDQRPGVVAESADHGGEEGAPEAGHEHRVVAQWLEQLLSPPCARDNRRSWCEFHSADGHSDEGGAGQGGRPGRRQDPQRGSAEAVE